MKTFKQKVLEKSGVCLCLFSLQCMVSHVGRGPKITLITSCLNEVGEMF